MSQGQQYEVSKVSRGQQIARRVVEAAQKLTEAPDSVEAKAGWAAAVNQLARHIEKLQS